MSLHSIKNLVHEEIEHCNRVLLRSLPSSIPLITQICEHLIQSGGKRARPLTVILMAKALGAQRDDFITLAVVIEFIHAATLLHDDVVDKSTLRRGLSTANTIWGSEASVLVGDYVYSRAFELMVAIDQMPIMDVLAKASNQIAEGEVAQLLQCNDPDTSEDYYYGVIERKTAKLFEAGAQCAAMLSGANESGIAKAADYGKHLGMAFQLVDDALDYHGDSSAMGKNAGDDLREGKPTLPLIHALKQADEAARTKIIAAIREGGCRDTSAIFEIIESTQAIDYTYAVAKEHIAKAKSCVAHIEDSPYKQALLDLADFTITRES